MLLHKLQQKLRRFPMGSDYRSAWQVLHIDPWLFFGIAAIIFAGFLILYSAGSHITPVGTNALGLVNPAAPSETSSAFALVKSQALHIGVAGIILFLLAQVSPITLRRYAPILYAITLFLLLAVLAIGHTGKGAERWLGAGPIRFQPSEFTQIIIPLALAWYYDSIDLPPSPRALILSAVIIIIPCLLIAKEPDLGTAIMTAIAGFTVLLLAGLRWRWLLIGFLVLALMSPIGWHFMHAYQRLRIETFFDPEKHPLGAGYHIIQSKIAIGSGGFFGQGWMHATQSQLHFLPENTTDFIFSVCAQQFGLFGCSILILLFLFVSCRGLYIAISAQDTFTRLLAGSMSVTFFMSFFVNVGMVSGIVPVVGVPLPLISYGGTSMIALMANFGILMSIKTHRKLITT